jgi:hypothetical protein
VVEKLEKLKRYIGVPLMMGKTPLTEIGDCFFAILTSDGYFCE